MKPITHGRRIRRAGEVRGKAIEILLSKIGCTTPDLSHKNPERVKIATEQIAGWQEKIDAISDMDHAEEIIYKINTEWGLGEATQVP